MKPSVYLSIFAVLSVVFGAAFLALAQMTLAMYGIPTDPANLLQARYFGASLASGGFFAWFVRNVGDSSIQRGALLASTIGAALGSIVSIWGLMDKVLGPLGWSSVLIYGLLTLGGAYCLVVQKRPALA